MRIEFIALAIASVASCSPVAKRTVAQVEADIANIQTQVTALDSAINAFPTTGGTLLQALIIHADATNLVTTLDTATTDTTGTTAFSEDDGATILAAVEAFEPTILDALNGIVAKQAAFTALPIGGVPALILDDLQSLSTATSAFENALIADSPADLVAQADSIQSTIDAAFATAIAAYS